MRLCEIPINPCRIIYLNGRQMDAQKLYGASVREPNPHVQGHGHVRFTKSQVKAWDIFSHEMALGLWEGRRPSAARFSEMVRPDSRFLDVSWCLIWKMAKHHRMNSFTLYKNRLACWQALPISALSGLYSFQNWVSTHISYLSKVKKMLPARGKR